jgi:hypothetical protein
MIESAHHVYLDDWQVFAWIYVAMSVLLFAAPSVLEWRTQAIMIGALCVVLAFIRWLGLEPKLFSRGWFIQFAYSDTTFENLARLIQVAIFAIGFFALFRGLWSIGLATLRQPREEKKKK